MTNFFLGVFSPIGTREPPMYALEVCDTPRLISLPRFCLVFAPTELKPLTLIEPDF